MTRGAMWEALSGGGGGRERRGGAASGRGACRRVGRLAAGVAHGVFGQRVARGLERDIIRGRKTNTKRDGIEERAPARARWHTSHGGRRDRRVFVVVVVVFHMQRDGEMDAMLPDVDGSWQRLCLQMRAATLVCQRANCTELEASWARLGPTSAECVCCSGDSELCLCCSIEQDYRANSDERRVIRCMLAPNNGLYLVHTRQSRSPRPTLAGSRN